MVKLRESFAAVLMAATVVATPAVSAAQAPPAAGEEVTLITGDRVVLTGSGHRVEPGAGRKVAFRSQVREGHLHVVPSDAEPLLAQGVLDRRLFDVTQLVEWGYGDAARADIPVISQGTSGQAFAPQNSRQVKRLSSIGMSTARVPKADALNTWKDLTGGARTLAVSGTKLWLDGRRSFFLDESVKQIGAPQAWQQGFTGKGVTVAVLDSGYDPDHRDLKDAVAYEHNFSDSPDMRDTLGHGTHVASTVAGRGEKYRGVAPGAKLAIGKVGASSPTDSAILAGMEWAAVEVKAKVVNMSFGTLDGPGLDPVEQAVNTLSEQTGALFVAAAGNNGRPGSVASPGSADAALTVGAVDKQGRTADFSSRGPRTGDHAIKPDVVAPGVDIMAPAAAGTADGPYRSMSGTSMAAPHVVGAAAIMAQRHPEWTGARLKAALIGSAAPKGDATLYEQGAGLVDLTRGLNQQVVAEPANLWAAFPWDGADERVATRTITYANEGDTPVTLDLSAQGDVLKLKDARVTVPAKGKAEVTLTIDARDQQTGDHPGTINATSGETVVRTPAGAYVEPESYNLTITTIGREGRKADPFFAQIYDAKTGAFHLPAFEDGVATIRLPKGDWHLYTDQWEKSTSTIAVTPAHIDGEDRSLTVDARQGKAVEVTVDDPDAERQDGVEQSLAHGGWNAGGIYHGLEGGFFVVPSRVSGLTYTFKTLWTSKDVSPSPYVYHLAYRRSGGLPEDPAYHAKRDELAKVTTTYRASGVAATGTPLAGIGTSKLPGTGMSALVGEIDLPATLVQYRTPGLAYESGLSTGTATMVDGGRVARRGETGEVWNAAVTGPSFLVPGGSRTGDRLIFSGAGLFADGGEGRSGFDTAATGTATLARDGREVARADLTSCSTYQPETCQLRAALPAEAGAYTLAASMRRQVEHSALSTGVESVWTFRSESTSEERALPLMAVRYSPEGLDAYNRAKKGSLTRVPLWIGRNSGSGEAKVGKVAVEMSADDGATWRRVPVTRDGSRWAAKVRNPDAAGFVSLRAVVTSADGAGLTQTITRAYAVG
ncbi:hypothetical protein E1292_11120 [Nonomuraea deserti]|uniref:Peptidase S8/S53 domain-containing protein n=1 Tax=Nonomuraea deserti TaxID=1848322 RepID=A0A4R4VS41_9ACTN|nr:S8 family serine peptidase [Nonomuraea deserti]TDD08682.1 hypothetical protein E1292_11120 [Nonomuraea deserti]